jgi:hypothetical protein
LQCKRTINKGPLTEAGKKEIMRLSAAIRGSMPKKKGRPEMKKGGPGWKKATEARTKQAAQLREGKITN